MLRRCVSVCLLLAFLLPASVHADELVKMIQKDLVALGYDPGNIQGELSTETTVAISSFQAENGLEVTGEATPQLAGIIKATLKQGSSAGGAAATASATEPADPATLRTAQQHCLEEKIAAKQASEKKKRGFGSLMRAVTNTAARYGGGSDLAKRVSETSYDIYNANATAQDWERAAEDLGLTQDELEACQNPPL